MATWLLDTCACVCAKSLQLCRLFVTLWAVAHQAPLSMGFSRQDYWSRLPYPPPGDLPNPGIETQFSHVASRFFYRLSHQGSPLFPKGKSATLFLLIAGSRFSCNQCILGATIIIWDFSRRFNFCQWDKISYYVSPWLSCLFVLNASHYVWSCASILQSSKV